MITQLEEAVRLLGDDIAGGMGRAFVERSTRLWCIVAGSTKEEISDEVFDLLVVRGLVKHHSDRAYVPTKLCKVEAESYAKSH